mmetsp:Transcript_25588/g.42874  ORF Transcript_25588/g.42874 Transcript_25588/m.42874 type:complete len:846 (+) Transcript_25588:875-3412(+)
MRLMQKGSVFVITSKGTIEACARDVQPPAQVLNSYMKEAFVKQSNHSSTSVKWGSISRLPCVVIRASRTSRGRLDVYYDGAIQTYGHDKEGLPPQGVAWNDTFLPMHEEAFAPLVPGKFLNGWHPYKLDVEIIQRQCMAREHIQMSLFTVFGDICSGMDDVVLRYATAVKTRYDAVLVMPGSSVQAVKNHLIDLAYSLRMWKDITTLPSHRQRLRLFYEELLVHYPKVLIVVLSLNRTIEPLEAIAPPGEVPPDCFVHIVVSSSIPLHPDMLPLIARIGEHTITGYRPAQSMRILRELPYDFKKDDVFIAFDAKRKENPPPNHEIVVEKLSVLLEGNAVAMHIACNFVSTGADKGNITIFEYVQNLEDSINRLEAARKDSQPLSPVFIVVADAVRAISRHRAPTLILSIMAYVDPSGIEIQLLALLMNSVDTHLRNKFTPALEFLLSVGLISKSANLNSVIIHTEVQMVLRALLVAERRYQGNEGGTASNAEATVFEHTGDILGALIKVFARLFKYIPGDVRADRRDRIAHLHVESVCLHAIQASSRLPRNIRESSLILICRAIEFTNNILRQREEARKLAVEINRYSENQVIFKEASVIRKEGKQDEYLPEVNNRVGVLVRMHCELTLARCDLALGHTSKAIEGFQTIITGLEKAKSVAVEQAGFNNREHKNSIAPQSGILSSMSTTDMGTSGLTKGTGRSGRHTDGTTGTQTFSDKKTYKELKRMRSADPAAVSNPDLPGSATSLKIRDIKSYDNLKQSDGGFTQLTTSGIESNPTGSMSDIPKHGVVEVQAYRITNFKEFNDAQTEYQGTKHENFSGNPINIFRGGKKASACFTIKLLSHLR